MYEQSQGERYGISEHGAKVSLRFMGNGFVQLSHPGERKGFSKTFNLCYLHGAGVQALLVGPPKGDGGRGGLRYGNGKIYHAKREGEGLGGCKSTEALRFGSCHDSE